MTEKINDHMTNGNIESFLKEKEEMLRAITPWPWYPVLSEACSYLDDPESIETLDFWTVSSDKNIEGWETDGGHPGYGIKKKDAEFISQSPELVSTLLRLVRAYREVAIRWIQEDYDNRIGLSPNDPIKQTFPYSVDKEAKRILNGKD